MFTKLIGKELEKYLYYLKVFEKMNEESASSKEKTEAYFCAINGNIPSWMK